jgi:drug/metabolite transporter (DMT)-like permease
MASELMFASMGAGVKLASETLPNEVIVFLRNLIGMGILLPWLLHAGPGGIATRVFHLHLLRAVMGVSAMYCFFYALAHLALADGMLLKMTAPIFMPLIAWLWLRESASALAVLAVPLGFAGVALVLKPDGAVHAAALIGLLGGLLAAVAKVTVRRLTRSEPTARIVLYFAILATAVSAVPLLWAWRAPTPQEWLILGLIGLAGTLGQILLTLGYASAPAARVSPFTYFSVVFAALYGYVFWGETLDLWFVLGAGLIAVAGLLAISGRAQARRAALATEE